MKIPEFEEFNSLDQLITYFHDENTCIEFLKNFRWKNGIECPYCDSKQIYHRRDGRFHCDNCNRNFSVLVKTIFQSTKLPLRKWFITIYLMINSKQGLASTHLMRMINVTQKTAWFILQKIKMVLKDEKINTDNVDSDLVEKESKKGKKYVVRQSKNRRNIPEKLKQFVRDGSRIYNDEIICIQTLTESELKECIVEDPEPLVKKDQNNSKQQLNTALLWQQFKRMVSGTHHYLSKSLLHRYVDEAVYRTEHHKDTTKENFYGVLEKIGSVVTYEDVRPHPQKVVVQPIRL